MGPGVEAVRSSVTSRTLGDELHPSGPQPMLYPGWGASEPPSGGYSVEKSVALAHLSGRLNSETFFRCIVHRRSPCPPRDARSKEGRAALVSLVTCVPSACIDHTSFVSSENTI